MLVTSNFSFSYSVFKRLVLQTSENQGLFGKGLRRGVVSEYALQSLLTTLKKKPFENIVGEGENAGNQYFSCFPTMFSTHPEKNLLSGNGLNYIYFVVCECVEFRPDQKFWPSVKGGDCLM